jgi:hypothetical protein
MRVNWLSIAILALALEAAAQINTAELAGTVSDQTGGVLRGAILTAVHAGTGARRVTHTNDAGEYYLPQLAPGSYDLTVQMPGFATEARQGIELAVGRQARLDVQLALGTLSEETVVVADTSELETRAAALSAVMDNHAMRELPLNGRDFAQLALLQPGVAPSRRSADSGGPGAKLVLNGNRPSQVSFTLDGADINDSNNNTPGSAAGVLLGVDTLQEFRVLTNAYSAAYGRSAGGVVTAVTRAGTNQPHGAIFEFVRNSAFDARNFFDSLTAPIPAFKRNQFGAEADGPILRHRTFFLASFEGLRQRLGMTTLTVVPDLNARQGIVAAQQPVAVNPSLPGYLDLIPLPNGRSFGDGTGQYSRQNSNSTDENFAAGRIDHRPSDRTFLFARYTYDSAQVRVPDNLGLVRADGNSRNQYLTAEATHVFTERLLDTGRFSLNRSYSAAANAYLRPIDPALSFLPGDPLGQISVTGLFSLGPSRFGPSFSKMSLFQFTDDLSYTLGRHSFKIGGDYRFYRLPTIRPQSPYGFYQFSSLVNFLLAKPSAVEMTLPNSTLERNWRQSMLDLYLQDDIQLTHRLTLNLGVRYERESVPQEANGLSANLRNPVLDAKATVGPLFVNPTNRGFAPRAGLAWDPFGDGKTSVRSGFGLFYDPLWSDFYANAGNRQPPFYTLGSINNPVFPNAYSLVSSPAFILGRQDVLQYRPRYPYSMQYNLTIQRQIASVGALTVGYAGERGIHIPRFVDENQAVPQILGDGRAFFPAGSAVRNPNFTGIRYKTTEGMSYYSALETSFERRFHQGIRLRLNYVFSRAIDTGSIDQTQGSDNDLPQTPDSITAERGLSNYSVSHLFTAFWTWDLPKAPGPRWLVKGWQWNAIATLASGNPFSPVIGYDRAGAKFQAGTSPQRPDLAAGRGTNPVLGGPDRYFDPSAFTLPAPGFYGNLGRNTLIGPGMEMIDVSLNKQFRVTEKIKAQFRTEMFNSLNHPNFAIPSQRTVFSASGPVGSAGRITSTLTSSRQLQLGLKLTF